MCGAADWAKKNSTALELAAAAAATALTMGAASPLLAGAAGAAGAGSGLLGGAAAGTAAGGAAAGLGAAGATGLGTASLFGPAGGALAAEGVTPFITGAGAAGSGLGGGTASLFGGAGLPGANLGGMLTAGLGAGEGGASIPTFADKINSGLSNILPGGNDTLSSLNSGLGKISKAQSAVKSSGLLGQQQAPPPPRPESFGQQAAPVNLTQYKTQPNSMMQPQLPPELAGLPPNDPRVIAYLKQMQGGMYG